MTFNTPNINSDKESLLRFGDEYLTPTIKSPKPFYPLRFEGLGEQLEAHYQMNNGRLDETLSEDVIVSEGDAQGEDVGGAVRIVTPHKAIDISQNELADINGSSYNDIISFLRKPTIVNSGVLSTTDGPSTFPVHGLFTGLDELIRTDKLRGVYALRADTVLTLQVNATPFMLGRYIVASIPSGGAAHVGNVVQRVNAHRFSKVQITQLNHVQMDINQDKMVQLVVPFMSGMSAFPISMGSDNGFKQGAPGYFFMYPYVPLEAVSGSLTATFTLWIHYENVKLYGNAIPQSESEALAPVMAIKSTEGAPLMIGSNRIFEPEEEATFQSRGSARKGKDVVGLEQNDGKYSKIISLAADVSESLSAVPLLSSVAGPLSWVLRAASSAAVAWGWSKPLLATDVIRTNADQTPYLAVHDAKATVMPMSLSIENRVSALPGFAGNDLDEMSIDFLKSIPSYFGSFTWPYTSAAGTILYSEISDPSAYIVSSTDGGSTVYSFTTVGMLGHLYNYYQGSLIINIKFAKTQFHAGRLMFCYNLKDPAQTEEPVSLTNFIYTHREIIDVTKGSEFSFELPYISCTPWSYSAKGLDGGQLSSASWSIMVLDPLMYTSVVSNAITAVLEVSGGKSLNFSVPATLGLNPASIINFQSADSKSNGRFIEGLSDSSDHLNDAANCMGEVSTSLRQVLKRGGVFYGSGSYLATTSGYVLPHVTNFYKTQAVGSPLGIGSSDPYNIISSFYCLGRGGFRSYILIGGGPQSSQYAWSYGFPYAVAATVLSPLVGGATSVTNWLKFAGSYGINITANGRSGDGMQTPQYLTAQCRNLLQCTVIGDTEGFYNDPSSPMVDKFVLNYRSFGTATATNAYYRSVSDDHNLGGFISIPPMVVIP